MTTETPPSAAGLGVYDDGGGPTPLRVACSIQDERDSEQVVGCLDSFESVTAVRLDPESLTEVAADIYVIDEGALAAVGQQLLDPDGPAHPTACLLVTDETETPVVAESAAVPERLEPLVTDIVSVPLDERKLRHRLGVLIELRRQSRRATRANARNRELLELLPEAVVVVRDRTIQYANAAAEGLFGVEASTLSGRPFDAFVAETDREAAADLLAAVWERQTTEFVSLDLAVGGESVTVEVAGTAVGLDGDTVELVCRRTDREQREAQLELYKAAMDEATVGITITDARETDNPLVYVNQEFERLTGLDREWMLDRNPRFAQSSRTDPETVGEIRRAIDDTEAISVELLNQRADGTEWHNALDISPVYQDDELTHFLGFQRDVTASHTQQSQLAVLDRVLRHNLRNRLNVVLGHAETLTEGASTEAVPLHATTICETAEELLTLSEKTRRFRAAIEADTEPAATVDLTAVLDDCLATITADYPEAVVGREIPDGIEIQSRRAVEFALTELLSNAVAHSEQEPPHVSIEAAETDTEVEVRITDDGPGIPADQRQAFADTTETPTDHAIGIGLWLVRWAVDSTGGDIEYAEADPHGSIVTLRLPAVGGGETKHSPSVRSPEPTADGDDGE